MGELDYIKWIREQTRRHPQVLVPPGDDCAVVAWHPDRSLLVTTDMLLEGSCFLREAGPERIGKKAMSVNLSDIAAMAGQPVAAVVSVGLPRDLPIAWAEAFFRSLQAQAEAFKTVIIGGDTNSWDGPITINITLFGEPTGNGPVTRSGAQPGDALMVTGTLGGSIRDHHLDFTPRVWEAQLLHSLVSLHAMIDISDGLSTDLHHLCEESGCGAEIWSHSIPINQAARQMGDDKSPLEHALSDGEDFELLFAVSEAEADHLSRTEPLKALGVNLSRIGRVTKDGAVLLIDSEGTRPLPRTGYEHLLGQ